MASLVTKTLNSLTRDHIEKAIRSLDAGHSHGFADSTFYDVIFNSKRYPPKAVVGLAAEIATGTQLVPKDFKGGEESKCFRVLRKAGFEISRKPKVAWILQGNPKDFPVEKHIEKLGFRYWTFDKLHKEAQLGDEVYIYKCGIGAAVIARGIVTELPKPQKDVNHPEIIGTSGTRRELIEGPDTFKIGIEITEQRVGNPNGQISRLEILGNPTLKTCTIMTSKQGSNFRIFENQRNELEKIWASKAGAKNVSETTGTKVATKRNAPWSRDELLLALELYLKNPKTPPEKHTEEIQQFSLMLNKLGHLLGVPIKDKYRNENGVYMKLMNFRRFDPDFKSTGSVGLKAGNKDEKVVWDAYAKRPDELKKACDAIRSFIETGAEYNQSLWWEDDESGSEAEEGKILTRQHRRRERNPQLAKKKKQQVMRRHGRLACEVCSFVYQKRYGERGRGFIECHHIKPVSTLTEGQKTSLDDLAVVCANCHRMIHASKPWLSIQDLKNLLVG
jgi:5-methylcytosine-specific restriction protein A